MAKGNDPIFVVQHGMVQMSSSGILGAFLRWPGRVRTLGASRISTAGCGIWIYGMFIVVWDGVDCVVWEVRCL